MYVHRYDSWFIRNEITAMNELRLIRELIDRDIKICLDVGCGTGWFTSRLNLNCVGVDPSFNMLKITKSRNIETIQAISEKLPIRKNSIDLILIIVTLCFVDDVEKAIQEVCKVLRNEGKLIICIIPKNSPWGMYYEKRRETSPFYKIANFLTGDEVIELCHKHSLKLQEVKCTIKYLPHDEAKIEEPSNECDEANFLCLKFVKQNR